MTPRPLLLLGAGGLAREALAAARFLAEQWQVVGMLDDNLATHGTSVDGVPVLGGTDLAHDHQDAAVLACVASAHRPSGRADLVRRLDIDAARWATVVHPAASVAPGTALGEGVLLLACAVITAPIEVGAHVVAMPHVLLTHDDEIGDFATFAGRASLGGGVIVERGAYLGQGCVVREGLTIGAEAVVGMGSVVLQDIPATQTWVGNPARKLR